MTQSAEIEGAAETGKGSQPPPLYRPFKRVSPLFARALVNTPVSANMVTLGWTVALVAASFALASEDTLTAALIVLVAVMLDVIDGDLARRRNRPSVSGTLLEQLGHWIGNMALAVGAGAAILLNDPSPRNILLAGTLAVAQAVYIAVVRQIRPGAASIPNRSWLKAAFRIIVKVYWVLSPIELPLAATFLVFGVDEGVVLAVAITLTASSALIFIPHFLLIRERDKVQWAASAASPRSHPFSAEANALAQTILLAHFPEARWWTPRTPTLPPAVLAMTGRQPMSSRAPILAAARGDLANGLPTLFGTEGRVLALACPTEAALEAVLSTLCERGEEVLIAGGNSAVRRWCLAAERAGLIANEIVAPFGETIDAETIAEALHRHPSTRAVCLSQSDDEGITTDLPDFADVMRSTPALFLVDACAGFCADPLQMDDWGIDVVVSASDSGLMAPAGLSLIALTPDIERTIDSDERSNGQTASFLDLRAHMAEGNEASTPAPSAPLAGLYLATQTILAAGVEAFVADRQRLAERFRRGCTERVGLTLTARRHSAACTSALLPKDVSLSAFQGQLFSKGRLVVATHSLPDGATALLFGHTGWLFDEDIDPAIEAIAESIEAVRSAEPVTTKARNEQVALISN